MQQSLNIAIPNSLNKFSKVCLEALKNSRFGQFITLGGAVGLALYHEFRLTKDVDAWWVPEATENDKQAVVNLLKSILETIGDVTIRRFGDVVSLDLRRDRKVVFNFQIANRSALLKLPVKSPWYPVTLDSFEDLIASKMTALIERGAPRDFIDIYEMCKQEYISISKCWELWQARELKRNVTTPDPQIGCEALLLHLSRIERIRPLDTIGDINKKNQAKKVRDWFKYDFCKGRI